MSYAAAFSTFAYINVVPMAARFNQLYWGPAETAFVEVVLAKGSGSQVFFLTGALGTPSQQTLNYGQPVPTGPFFTAMCIPGVGSGAAYAQFNSDERQLDRSDPDQRSAVEFMSLGELEALLGRGQMFAVNCGQANYKNDLIAAFAPAKKNNNGQSVTFNPDSHRRETQLLGNRDPGDRCTLDSECKIPMECISNKCTCVDCKNIQPISLTGATQQEIDDIARIMCEGHTQPTDPLLLSKYFGSLQRASCTCKWDTSTDECKP